MLDRATRLALVFLFLALLMTVLTWYILLNRSHERVPMRAKLVQPVKRVEVTADY